MKARDTSHITWEQLATIAAVAAGITLPLYPIGLTVLMAQFSTSYHLDYSTASYAALLMPRDSVLAQAIRVVWVYPWLFSMIPIVFPGVLSRKRFPTLQPPMSRVLRLDLDHNREFEFMIRLAVVGVIGSILLNYIVLPILVVGNWRLILLLMVQVILSLVLVEIHRSSVRAGRSILLELLQIIVAVYIGALICAVLVSGVSEPPLPSAELRVQEDSSVTIVAKVLRHTEGYWYVLDEKNGSIQAVPDGIAETVRIVTTQSSGYALSTSVTLSDKQDLAVNLLTRVYNAALIAMLLALYGFYRRAGWLSSKWLRTSVAILGSVVIFAVLNYLPVLIGLWTHRPSTTNYTVWHSIPSAFAWASTFIIASTRLSKRIAAGQKCSSRKRGSQCPEKYGLSSINIARLLSYCRTLG